MQIKPGFALLVACMLHSAAFAGGSIPITDVVLYPGSATVERAAHVSAGMTQLEIKGLPANFDTQTIRVQADPGIHVGQVVTQDAGRTEATGTREAEIEAKIQALQDKQAALDVDAKSAALVQHYLENLNGSGAAAGGQAQPLIDAKSMATVIETIRHGATDAFERMQKVAVQKRDIGESIKALQRDLARVRSGTKDERNITVTLAVQQAGTVRLSYQINGAGWKPGYRAALDSATSTLELERLATISQKTGEDWSGVRMKLSTGQPRLSPQAPEPNPWLLTYYKPQPVLAKSFAARSAPAPSYAPAPQAVMAYDMAKSEEADSYQAPILEVENTFATEFEVPARVTLPADGREISVNLSAQSLPVKQKVRIAPRIDTVAVVTAEAARPTGVWLSGGIQLFRDGNYVGATQWNAQASERFVFPFGRDDLVRVKVDRAQQQSGTGGLLSQHAERHVADVYTLTSHHKTPVDLLVLESTPVSTSDEVKVESVFQPKPTLESWEQRQGVVGWEKSLAPAESLKISVDYKLSYPKDGSVAGLP